MTPPPHGGTTIDSSTILHLAHVGKRYGRTRTSTRRRGVTGLFDDLRGRTSRGYEEVQPSEFWALHDVSLTLSRGEGLGVMGLNGAGKSTLLRLVAGIAKPDVGTIQVGGQVATLLDLGTFEPLETGRQAIQTSPVLWGRSGKQLAALEAEIIDFSGLEPYIDAPVRTYSKGMRMRLGFSIAVLSAPDLLIIDEVLAVGDLAFQQKCVDYLRRFISRGGSLLVVSHSISALEALCGRGLLLEGGIGTRFGPIEEVTAAFSEIVLDQEEGATRVHATRGVPMPLSTKALDAPPPSEATIEPTPEPPPPIEPASTEPPEVQSPATLESMQPAPPEAEPEYDPANEKGAARLLAPTHGRPVGFTHVRVTPDDGSAVYPQSGCTISVGYRSDLPPVRVQCAVAIFSADSQIVLATAISAEDEVLHLVAGYGEFEAKLAQIPLPPGPYLLRVAIIDHNTRQPLGLHGWETPASRLRVEPTGSSEPEPTETRAVLWPPRAHWSFAPASGSQHDLTAARTAEG
ncbi:MAG: ATP-binding cassette domain-containing protein [Acidimicrobiales bacterium]|nr:ATP-binding cassette domain-containing protein [Acidimicrobiales bacterium]